MFCRGECDLSTGGLTITLERVDALDFSLPLYPDQTGLIMKATRNVALNYWVYIKVFESSLWSCNLVATFILLSCFMLLKLGKDTPICYAAFESVSFVLGTLVQRRTD